MGVGKHGIIFATSEPLLADMRMYAGSHLQFPN